VTGFTVAAGSSIVAPEQTGVVGGRIAARAPSVPTHGFAGARPVWRARAGGQQTRGGMTDRIAFWLGLAIVAGLGLDLALVGTGHLLLIGARFIDFIDYLAFWR
jgi:hypothetical protein